MAGRSFTPNAYRYGFNGQEKDEDVAPGVFTAEYWEYDSRLGRRWNRDIMASSQPGWSPYKVLNNSPILMIDPNGAKEYPTYDAYKNELKGEAIAEDKWIGQDGHWLTSDRNNLTVRWSGANITNLKYARENQYAAFEQIDDLYKWIDRRLKEQGHEIKWVKGAMSLTGQLRNMQFMTSSAEEFSVVDLMMDLNVGICNLAVKKFGEVLNGKEIFKGEAAYDWDLKMIIQEQKYQAEPIYSRHQGHKSIADIQGIMYSNLPSIFGHIPNFAWFRPDKTKVDIVHDWQIRVDVPMLMLYPETHRLISKPSQLSKNMLDEDGTLNARWTGIMKNYQVK